MPSRPPPGSEQLRLAGLAAYDRMLGLELERLVADGCITRPRGAKSAALPLSQGGVVVRTSKICGGCPVAKRIRTTVAEVTSPLCSDALVNTTEPLAAVGRRKATCPST
jgi:hypothetical protein